MKNIPVFLKVYTALNRYEDRFYSILKKIIATMMLIVTIVVVYQVVYRNIVIKFVSVSSIFTEEFARYGVIWIMFLCLPVCLKEGRFAAVTVIIERVKPKMKIAIYIFTQLLAIIFMAVSMYYSFRFVRSNLLFTSPSMRLPGIYIYSCIPIGTGLSMLQMIIDLIGVLSGGLSPFESLLTPEGSGGGD